MRESTSLRLPELEKGSSIFDYKVRQIYLIQPLKQSGESQHWGVETLELSDGELRSSGYHVRRYIGIHNGSLTSPSAYGDILIPNVSSIRTDFLLDGCVRSLKLALLITLNIQGLAETFS